MVNGYDRGLPQLLERVAFVPRVHIDIPLGRITPRTLSLIQISTRTQVMDPNSTQSPKKSKKEKKEKEKEKDEIIIPLEDLSPIAKPLAQKKLVKKLHKTIKKGVSAAPTHFYMLMPSWPTASKARQVKRGVKEVVKGIRKGERGSVTTQVLLLISGANP